MCSHMLSCSLTSTPMPICVLSPVCHKHLEKLGNLMRTGKWPPCISLFSLSAPELFFISVCGLRSALTGRVLSLCGLSSIPTLFFISVCGLVSGLTGRVLFYLYVVLVQSQHYSSSLCVVLLAVFLLLLIIFLSLPCIFILNLWLHVK